MNLDYAKSDGLITAVIQDHASGRVLMVGYMNEEAFRKTVETGYATFYSRSRKKLWLKGESSGHRLVVKAIETDCDRDAVLVKVEAQGPGVCHEGYESCFFRRLEGGDWQVAETRTYDPESVYGGKACSSNSASPRAAWKTPPSTCSAAPVFRSPPAAAPTSRASTIPKSNAC